MKRNINDILAGYGAPERSLFGASKKLWEQHKNDKGAKPEVEAPPETPDVDIIGCGISNKDVSLGSFISQVKPHLIEGSVTYQITNRSHLCENPEQLRWEEENGHCKDITPLEQAYKEFCEKALSIIASHPKMNGENHPHQIIFPHLRYKVIPSKFTIIK